MEFITDHGFALLQSVGIVGGLIYTGLAFRFDARVRKTANLMDLTAEHRRIWEQLYQSPELARVRELSVDLDENPVTEQEELFVNLLILHLSTSYRAIEIGVLEAPHALEDDISQFFSRPIPHQIWVNRVHLLDKDFIAFVMSVLEKEG